MTQPVLQNHLPDPPWMTPHTRKLPGIQPLDMADWLRVDDAYAGQMALRDGLIATRADQVIGALDSARDAVAELYDFTLAHLPAGFSRAGDQITRPDGCVVVLDPARPLHSLGRLVQEDLCLMQPDGRGEHLLSAAVLCFPAGWTLAEKLGRAMMRIHLPVEKYTEDVGKRVQRMMDLLRVDAPLWRVNGHHSRAPLFNPRRESDTKVEDDEAALPFIRSERQCLIRLPQTGAVLFSIHTYLVAIGSLTPDQAQMLAQNPIHRAT